MSASDHKACNEKRPIDAHVEKTAGIAGCSRKTEDQPFT